MNKSPLITLLQEEQDRLDLQHASFELVLGGRLGLAPVGEPKFVIDVATGTGIWANEFGSPPIV